MGGTTGGNGGVAGNGGASSADAGAGDMAGAAGAVAEPNAIAIAKLEPTTGNMVTGVARFEQTGDEVKLLVTLTSCPAGPHALHLHVNPDCSDDANASGGNWSPQGEGIDEITCADDGTASLVFTPAAGTWTIGGAPSSDLLVHSVVLHAGGKSDVTGRIACGLPLAQP
jgi:Cu-Zn family superoxide dismutase